MRSPTSDGATCGLAPALRERHCDPQPHISGGRRRELSAAPANAILVHGSSCTIRQQCKGPVGWLLKAVLLYNRRRPVDGEPRHHLELINGF
jgi:hypothetical protein